VRLNARTNRGRNPRPGAGFTLVEVLVALVVLCIGLLGFASLVVAGLRENRVAMEHTIATRLLADMADHIRANRAAAPSYALDADTLLNPPGATCGAPGECTPSMLAALDLYRWQRDAIDNLPEAGTSIVVTPSPGGVHTCEITLRWRQAGEADRAASSITVQA
jgi:type IV pilus assembly protein PilV